MAIMATAKTIDDILMLFFITTSVDQCAGLPGWLRLPNGQAFSSPIGHARCATPSRNLRATTHSSESVRIRPRSRRGGNHAATSEHS